MKSALPARPHTSFIMQVLLFLIAMFALPCAAQAHSALVNWDREHPLAARLGPFKLSSSRPLKKSDDEYVILHVSVKQGRAANIKVERAFEDVVVSMGVGRIDPASAFPQLLITSYTGGAHCCVHFQIMDFIAGKWRIVDLGEFDGDPPSTFPVDIDGDGIIDIERADDRFAYAFGCYACSWMPPRVFNIRNGKVRDVSAAPRYRALYEKDFKDALEQCRKHFNAACAAMVADGYRIGRVEEAWQVAMASITPEEGWLPGCKSPKINGICPKDQSFRADEFPAALTQFLKDNGFTPGPLLRTRSRA